MWHEVTAEFAAMRLTGSNPVPCIASKRAIHATTEDRIPCVVAPFYFSGVERHCSLILFTFHAGSKQEVAGNVVRRLDGIHLMCYIKINSQRVVATYVHLHLVISQ